MAAAKRGPAWFVPGASKSGAWSPGCGRGSAPLAWFPTLCRACAFSPPLHLLLRLPRVSSRLLASSYCDAAHQREDWATHKAACLFYSAKAAKAAPTGGAGPRGILDESAPKSEFTGTFRWDSATTFDPMPPSGAVATGPPTLGSWPDFMGWRGLSSWSPQVVDALSFPLTLAYGMVLCGLTGRLRAASRAAGGGHVALAIVGAAARAEERILRETAYWGELALVLPRLPLLLCFVGPEVSPARHGLPPVDVSLGGQVKAMCFRGSRYPSSYLWIASSQRS